MERDLSEFLDKYDDACSADIETIYLCDKALEEGYEAGYKQAIDDYMKALCDKCLDLKNECYKLECPFCDDGCDIANIAEQMKEVRNE